MRHKCFPSLGSDLREVFPLLAPQPQPLGLLSGSVVHVWMGELGSHGGGCLFRRLLPAEVETQLTKRDTVILQMDQQHSLHLFWV